MPVHEGTTQVKDAATHRLGIHQPQQNDGGEGTERGDPEANLAGISQGGASPNPGVVKQQVLRDDGVHDPHQRQRERSDDSLLLCDHLHKCSGGLYCELERGSWNGIKHKAGLESQKRNAGFPGARDTLLIRLDSRQNKTSKA